MIQHFEVALWLAQIISVDRLTDEQSGDPAALRRTLLRGDLIVSTPGILAGALARGVVDHDVVASFDLVIVDEFDQFVVIDEVDRQSSTRYAELWQRLVTQLPKGARYIIKSATLGLDQVGNVNRTRTKAVLRAELISQRLKPVKIIIPERSFAEVVPYKPVQMTEIYDKNVASRSERSAPSSG